MRLASFRANGGSRDVGIVTENGVISLGRRLRISGLRHLLTDDRLSAAEAFLSAPADYRLEEVTWLPLIGDAAHFLCVGTNYADHLKDVQNAGVALPQPKAPPKAPPLFIRFPETLVGHGNPLLIPGVSDSFDYEGELAAIIGKGGRHIPEVDALRHVAGYSCFNDGSIRDWQFHTSQVTSGKNFVSTGGFGPWMVTADEIPDPQKLAITTRLNGTVLQDGHTSAMIFTVAKIISYASALFPLAPGDVIATGTPNGVGFSRTPPIFMKEGDVCEVAMEGIGILSNKIAKAANE